MRRILGCFIFFMILMTSQIFAGTVYYVDATNGNDLNTGTSEDQAWKTVNKVNNSAFSAGDIIKFKKGEIWREQLTIPSSGSSENPITFTSYGNGNLPEICGADVITGWVLYADNIYLKTGITTEPKIVLFDGTIGTNESVTADLDANNEWYYNATNDILYIYSTSNPSGKTIEVGQRNFCIYAINKDYITVGEIQCYGANKYGSISFANCTGITVQNCNVEKNYEVAIKVTANNVNNSDITIIGNTCTGTSMNNKDGIRLQEWNAGNLSNMTISNNTVSNFEWRGILIVGAAKNDRTSGHTISGNTVSNCGDGLYLINVNNSEISNNNFHNNTDTGGMGELYGIGVLECDNNIFEYNALYYNAGEGMELSSEAGGSGCNGNIIRYNNIHDNNRNGGIMISNAIGTGQNEIYYNLIYNHTGGSAFFVRDPGHEIYNNVLYNNARGLFIYSNDGDNIKFKNNIIANTATRHVDVTSGVTGLDCDYNLYDDDTGTKFRWAGTNYNFANWKAQSSQDGNSPPPASPSFVDASNGNFLLQIASLCIDAGTYVGLTKDYAGHTVPYGWGVDIGSYEYTGTIHLDAEINASPTSGEVPLIVNFTGNATGGTPPYTYSWDFGDGTSSSEQIPTHTYSDPGDYAVTLTVTDSESNQNEDSLIINASAVIIPLEASFIASPISGEVPLTVNFTGSATGGTEPYTYSWDFGDSTSSNEQIPSHTYNDPGDYTVILTVTDSQSNQDSDSLIINASTPAIPLEASCAASPTSGEVPLTVNFTGIATGGTEPYTYSWDFGDSTSSSGQNPSHTYNDPGDYTVTLTVTDSESNQDSDSLTINVSTPPTQLVASCDASPTSGEVPLTVNFTGNASGGTPPYNYNWNFGDSTSSSGKNPTHPYSQAGDYTVTFTVTDTDSNQDTDSLIINVYDPDAPLVASCAASPYSGEIPLIVEFTGSATGGVLPYSYSWDFGDSTSSTEQNPTHTYSDAGDYTVYLTVTDSDSNQDNDSLIINASAPVIPLEASCVASPTSAEIPFTVNFMGNATGGVLPYSYSWDFGDGTSSSEQNPSHTYNDAGDYTVILTVTDSENNQDSDSLTINAFVDEAYLSCSPKSLYFGATTSGNETADQYLRIINAGSGTLTWNIEDDADWLSCSPSSGTDRGEITVSVNASGLSLGLYVATITVSSSEAYNSPQYVSVNFRVYEPEQESPPFGSLDTPVNGSTVSGSIPVTGWALDDIEVIRLEIKRNSDPLDPPEAIGPDGLVYIGDAVFIEGVRPDVENSYADYPLNSRAGWGYMLLTNDLPYRGNGSFTIYTFAYDASGHREEIGRKTILCDNINRVKPFGTIDTPGQGEIIRGSDYINFGWALTPLPKTIPKDGSTIWIWVDGVQVGHPVYDQYREDIAMLYPEYNNAQGAVGYYYLDTTQYENGMHAIAWSVMDDEGEVDGIGARYFFIDNIEIASVHNGSFGLRSIYREDAEGRLRIGIKEVRREYRPRVDSDRELNAKSILKIQIEEMEPVRIALEESSSGNMEYIGWGENEWKALPIGSTLDREKGIFSWIPTPGFIGSYVLHFAVTDGSYMSKPLRVEVHVIPKRDRNKENW